MPEILGVIAQLSPDRVIEGFYTVEDGMLTMVYGNGDPVLVMDEKVQHRLAEGENPRVIAGRLTKQIRKRLIGETVDGFNDPIRYQNAGIA